MINTGGVAATNMGNPATPINLLDIAVDANGGIYSTAGQSGNYKFTSGTTWAADATGQHTASTITGGVGGQVWEAGIDASVQSPNGNIFTRNSNGTWFDDERVRTGTLGNSQVIRVLSGNYTITETLPTNWELQSLSFVDPTPSGSSTDIANKAVTLNVAAGEIVNVVFENGLITPFEMSATCAIAYTEDFGNSTVINQAGPALTGQTNYHYLSSPLPSVRGNDGYYKILDNSANFADFASGTNFYDHTPPVDNLGRMMVVNAAFDQGIFFRRRFTGIVPSRTYNFSAWLASISNSLVKPNVGFRVLDAATGALIASGSSGSITTTFTWQQSQLSFTTGSTTTSIDLILFNNVAGNSGNDLALDDIRFTMSGPATPGVTTANQTSCAGTGSLTITAPLGSGLEYSIDGGFTYQTGTTFTGLPPGTYSVTARFAETGCVSFPATTATITAFAGCGTGYIYVHKSALNEESSVDFPFGGSTTGSFSLNDQEDNLDVTDIGAGTDRVFASAGAGVAIYQRINGSSQWTLVGGGGAIAVDGGANGASVHANTPGAVYYHDGTNFSQNAGSVGATDVAFDRVNNRIFYRGTGGTVFYKTPVMTGTLTGWTQVGTIVANRIDASSFGDVLVFIRTSDGNVCTSTITGTVTVIGKPASVATVVDVTRADDGTIYIQTNLQTVWKYSGGVWTEEPSSRGGQYITAGIGSQVWQSQLSTPTGGRSIWTRSGSSASTGVWLDDERVRTTVQNGNSAMIAVAPGTHTIGEQAVTDWALQGITIYDPTNNSTADTINRKATLNVASGEIVHVTFQNGLYQTSAVAKNCTTPFLEDFTTTATVPTTKATPLTGLTNYHWQGAAAVPVSDGYYKVVQRSDDAGFGATQSANYNTLQDHSGTLNDGGYFLFVNANYASDAFYRRRFTNLVVGASYKLSYYVMNVTGNTTAGPRVAPGGTTTLVPINVKTSVADPNGSELGTNVTGNITTVGQWILQTYTFTALNDTLDIALKNNGTGGVGNDIGIDDITFVLNSPASPTAAVTSAICGGTGTITVTSPLGADYEYSKDGSTYQTSVTFAGLAPGTYPITARFVGSTICASVINNLVVSPTICGTVFSDNNGNTLIDGADNGNNLPVQLYVYLLNNSGIVVDSAHVASDGTYVLQAASNQNYTLYLSQDQYPIGTNAALNRITNIPPTGWVNSGENNGNTGAGDGTPNGVLSVIVGTTGMINQNFGLIDRCSLFASGNIDSDGDGVADRCDLDDDNDGILDTDENECLGAAAATYPAGFLDLKPSEFGINFIGTAQLGLNLTADLSHKFGYPPNSGKIIVHITNANIHPNADAFYVRGDLPVTDWEVGGSMGAAIAIEHGMEYFSYQRREIRMYNFEAELDVRIPVSNTTPASNWSTAVTNNVHSMVNNTANNYIGVGNGAMLLAGTVKPDTKRFGLFTNDVGTDRWSTYFVRILSECDDDMDGIPNRLDKDSDNDGCMDAVEGGGGFSYADLNTDGSLIGGVSATGIPTAAGVGQAIGTSQDGTQKALACVASISGNVFNDANRTTIIDGTETFSSLPAPLYVYLVNQQGIVVDSAHVASNGSYTLQATPNQGYALLLSTVPYPIGTDTASSPIDRTPPGGWVNTGENLGNTGGGDLVPNGILEVTITTFAVSNANFGIQQPPTANNDSRLNNAYGSTVLINVLANDTDPAPGSLVPTTVTLVAPSNATSIVYDVPGGDIISMTILGQGTWSVNESSGAITFTPQPGFVGNPTPIQYTVDDNAGFSSNPATVTVGYQNPVSIAGNVFNDANGNTVVDGGEKFASGLALPAPLYVYLVNTDGLIVDSAHVAADGSYELQAGQNQTYTLKLSAEPYEVGTSPAINTAPPAGWVTTGENGNGSGDGNPDGELVVSTATNNMINKNFGIQRPPEAQPVEWTVDDANINVHYTLGTKSLNAFTDDRYMNGNDDDDGALTGGSQAISLKVTSLPDAEFAKLYYDADGSGPNPPVEIPYAGYEIANYDPANMSIVFLSQNPPPVISFTYDITDMAGAYSGLPATYTINMGTVLPVTGLQLQGTLSNNTANLGWSTLTEQGSSYFVVERSTDGVRFAEIGRVAAAGNSNTQKNYSYKDGSLPEGVTAWYRVRMVGFDGQSRQSNMVGLTLQITYQLKIYPNPAKDFVLVRGLKAKAELRLLDAAGKVLRVQREGGNTARINLAGFASGLYLVQVLEGGKLVSTGRIVKE